MILNTGVSSCEQVERERASKWIYVQCVLVKIGNAYGSCYDRQRDATLERGDTIEIIFRVKD